MCEFTKGRFIVGAYLLSMEECVLLLEASSASVSAVTAENMLNRFIAEHRRS